MKDKFIFCQDYLEHMPHGCGTKWGIAPKNCLCLFDFALKYPVLEEKLEYGYWIDPVLFQL